MDYRGIKVQFETKVVRGDQGWDPHTGAVSFPIYQSATFRHPSLGQTTGWDYSRQGNPTRTELENTFAQMEEGVAGFAFSTGMSAVSAVMELFKVGDHILFCDDLYGGTYRYNQELGLRHGLEPEYTDFRDLEVLKSKIRPNTRGIFVETPSNPTMKICDLRAISDLCRKNNLLFIVDNTFLTPYFQKPLNLGAHVVIHSGTKFLAGHNDILAGLVAVRDPELAKTLTMIQKTLGAVLSPFDCWLLLRGMKTLTLRLQKQQSNALALAKFLEAHPMVTQVYYPGLESHPGHELHRSQSAGFGAMISFRVKSPELVAKVLESVKLIIFAESLGGVETLITYPLVQTHAYMPKAVLDELGVDETLLRLSVGIEALEDLESDLAQALG